MPVRISVGPECAASVYSLAGRAFEHKKDASWAGVRAWLHPLEAALAGLAGCSDACDEDSARAEDAAASLPSPLQVPSRKTTTDEGLRLKKAAVWRKGIKVKLRAPSAGCKSQRGKEEAV